MNSWTVACQVPLSTGCSRQEYWRGLPFPSPGDHPNPGIKPTSSTLAGRFLTTEPLPLESPLGSTKHFVIPSQISNQYRPAVRTENHWNINWFKKKKGHETLVRWWCRKMEKVNFTFKYWIKHLLYERQSPFNTTLREPNIWTLLPVKTMSFIEWRWHSKSVRKGGIINKGWLHTCRGAGTLSGTKDAMAGKDKKGLKSTCLVEKNLNFQWWLFGKDANIWK